MKAQLTIQQLLLAAADFTQIESTHNEPALYGVTDGKRVGTYWEHKFMDYLSENYSYQRGNSAAGIDIPDLEVDIKTTSIKQPQSSFPFKSATQKIFGLGYNLLVFVYAKYDNHQTRTGRLEIQHTIFLDKSRTADFQTTAGLLDIISHNGKKDDIIAFLMSRNLPVDDIVVSQLAERILESSPNQGYLTVSNALQWRLQYNRVIQEAGNISGIIRVG